MTAPLGIILAGGQARRMGGGDKGLLDLGGRSLLDRVIERIEGQVGGLALNANGDPARFAGFGLPVLLGIAGFWYMSSTAPEAERREIAERVYPLRVVTVQPTTVVPRAVGFGTAEPAKTWRAIARAA